MTVHTMAPLRAKKRNALPTSAFALPEKRKFPIHDAAHARNAMARLEQQKGSLSAGEYTRAKANILRAYKRFGIKTDTTPGRKGTHASIRTAGLSIHVHHMSDRAAPVVGERLCNAVEIAPPESDDNEPTWNQIAKIGQWAGHPAGPFRIGPEEIAQMVANFLATTNRRLPVDFEHASEADCTDGSIPTAGAPAQAWVTALEDRGPNGLWGLFEWMEPARTYVREKKYLYLSPAIRFGSKDRVTGKSIGARLTSVALTNNPFLDGMQPLAASDREGSTTMSGSAYSPNEYMPKMRAVMRMGETATAQECLSKLKQLEDLYASAGGVCMHQGVNLEDYLPAMRDMMQLPLSSSYEHLFEAMRELLHAAAGELEEEEEEGPPSSVGDLMRDNMANEETAKQLRDAEARIVTLSAREAELSNKVASAEAAAAQATLKLRDAEGSLTEAQATIAAKDAEIRALKDADAKRAESEQERRVDEAFATYKDRKHLSDADKKAMRIVLKSDPTTFETLYPRVEPAQQHLLRNVAGGREAPATTAPAQYGMSKQDQFRALKDKHIKAGMSYEDAIIQANRELSAQSA